MARSGMVVKKMPLNTPPYADIPDVGLSNGSSQLINGYLYKVPGEDGAITFRRPSLSSAVFADLNVAGAPNGQFWWENRGVALVVANNIIYSINQAGTVTQITGATLNGTLRPTFAMAGLTGNSVVIANGGQMVYTDGVTATTITGGSPPTNVSHVAYMNNFVIANNIGSAKWYWSNVNDLTTWNALNFASKEGRADYVRAIDVRFDEVVLCGSQTTEYWYLDQTGQSTFSKYSGATTERGTIAPYSFVFAGNMHYMIDNERNFIALANRVPKVISNPFQSVIQNWTDIANVFCLPITCNGRTFLVITSPGDDQSIVYDWQYNTWHGYWTRWNKTFATDERWLVNSYCYCPSWGKHLVGDRRTGKIYTLSKDNYSDAGEEVRFVRQTGWRDYGVKLGKRSNRISITLQRGIGTEADETVAPSFSVRSRDDGSSTWQPTRDGSLGAIGETESIVDFYQNGVYRTRQDEYIFTDMAPWMMVDAEEVFEVLSR
jgi:hypothetical protein